MDVKALAIEWLDREIKHPENTTLALAQFLDRIRAEARAEALRDAADRAIAWYRAGQLIPAHKESFAIKGLRAAILADKPNDRDGLLYKSDVDDRG